MAVRRQALTLPRFIPPMLAKLGTPFDAADFLFEVKWDGTRTLVFIDQDGYWMVNRRRIDMTDRYPEFEFLGKLPAGTVLDAEMVVWHDGKPDFGQLQSREQARSPLKIRSLARTMPATLMAFDLLYLTFQSLMNQPLAERRKQLEAVVAKAKQPKLALSEGIVGQGKAFFQEVCNRGLEGVMAKRLDSKYAPGKRTGAWIKIKRGEKLCCAIIGFLPSGKDDFKSLILAADHDGQLRCVGKVGTGFDNALRTKLNRLLWSRLRSKPIVPSKIKGKWVEPGLYCTVRCMERTSGGELRAPVFEELQVE